MNRVHKSLKMLGKVVREIKQGWNDTLDETVRKHEFQIAEQEKRIAGAEADKAKFENERWQRARSCAWEEEKKMEKPDQYSLSQKIKRLEEMKRRDELSKDPDPNGLLK